MKVTDSRETKQTISLEDFANSSRYHKQMRQLYERNPTMLKYLLLLNEKLKAFKKRIKRDTRKDHQKAIEKAILSVNSMIDTIGDNVLEQNSPQNPEIRNTLNALNHAQMNMGEALSAFRFFVFKEEEDNGELR